MPKSSSGSRASPRSSSGATIPRAQPVNVPSDAPPRATAPASAPARGAPASDKDRMAAAAKQRDAVRRFGRCPLCGVRAAEVEVALWLLKTRVCVRCAQAGNQVVSVAKRFL
jgi:hypothetical protein